MEMPGKEDGLVRRIIVRKSSLIEGDARDTKGEADRGVGRGRGRPPHP